MCGEYGDKFDRPHYHAILFGYAPKDEVLEGYSNREPIYRSPSLERIWGRGRVITGAASFESAAYIARYVTKKITGEKADEHYTKTCPYTLQEFRLAPEYGRMSRRPGIGHDYICSYFGEVSTTDEIIIRGHPRRPPRYYTDYVRTSDPDAYELLKAKRRKNAVPEENTGDRLRQREAVKFAQYNQLKRGYDNEA